MIDGVVDQARVVKNSKNDWSRVCVLYDTVRPIVSSRTCFGSPSASGHKGNHSIDQGPFGQSAG
jgi:hypothetical protein